MYFLEKAQLSSNSASNLLHFLKQIPPCCPGSHSQTASAWCLFPCAIALWCHCIITLCFPLHSFTVSVPFPEVESYISVLHRIQIFPSASLLSPHPCVSPLTVHVVSPLLSPKLNCGKRWGRKVGDNSVQVSVSSLIHFFLPVLPSKPHSFHLSLSAIPGFDLLSRPQSSRRLPLLPSPLSSVPLFIPLQSYSMLAVGAALIPSSK